MFQETSGLIVSGIFLRCKNCSHEEMMFRLKKDSLQARLSLLIGCSAVFHIHAQAINVQSGCCVGLAQGASGGKE
jgi:hypothetical protein